MQTGCFCAVPVMCKTSFASYRIIQMFNAYMYDIATDSRCEGNLVKMTDLYFNEATLNRLQLLDRYSS